MSKKNNTTKIKSSETLNFMEDKKNINNETAFNTLSVEIIKDNLKEQISLIGIGELLNYTKINYIENFEEKYNYVISMIDSDDKLLLDELNDTRESFYNYVLGLIKEHFSIGFEFNFSLSGEEVKHYIVSLYKFFVLEFDETIKNFVFNNITKDYKNILLSMKNKVNKKDIMFNLIKKEVGSIDKAVIIYSTDTYIESLEIEDIEDFIEDSLKDKNDSMEDYREDIKDIFIDGVDDILESASLSIDVKVLNKIIKTICTEDTKLFLTLRTRLINYYKNVK